MFDFRMIQTSATKCGLKCSYIPTIDYSAGFKPQPQSVVSSVHIFQQ